MYLLGDIRAKKHLTVMEPLKIIVFPDVWRPWFALGVTAPLAPPIMDPLGGTKRMLGVSAA